MKASKFQISIWLMFISFIGLAQLNISQNTDGSFSGCSGTWTDSGGNGNGAGAYYNDNEIYVITICPDVAGQVMSITFDSFELEDGFDFMTTYNGNSTNLADQMGVETGTSLNGLTVESTSPDGCLTFLFDSDGTVGAAGWSATINCVTPCANPTAGGIIVGESSPYQMCPGGTVDFSGSSSALGNGNSFVSYEWDFGDGSTGTGVNASHIYADAGNYVINLTVTDDNGCENSNNIDLEVYAGTTPTFVGTTPDFSVCIDEPACLDGVVNPTTWVGSPPPNLVETTPLPDGAGSCYSTGIDYNVFAPGQTLDDINDLLSIFANMEHSWIGDLQISITCPDATSVILVNYDSAISAWLGEPIDDETSGPGVGWDYYWSPTSTNGTFDANDPGASVSLPSGTYESDNDLSALVGCPLNGTWEIEICDDQGLDDGYIFEWGLNFDPSIYPDPVTFTPVYESDCTGSAWSGAGITSTSADCNNICIDSSIPGDYDYVYTVNDDFGCTYNTTTTVTVLPATDPSCPNCAITDFTANINICDPADNTYSIDGTIEFVDNPTTGLLIVEDCNGNQQTFDASTVTSPVNYSLTGLVADGLDCDVHVYFEDLTTCEQTIPYTAPADCTPPCNIDYFYASIGICDPNTDTYQVDGTVEFSNEPATGNIVIEISTVADGIIGTVSEELPTASPYAWSVTGLDADGSDIIITVYFDDNPTCTATLNATAPNGCTCTSDIGTFGITQTGDGINTQVLCFGDQLDITSNLDYTSPSDESPLTDGNGNPITYDPGLMYLVYTCAPTVLNPNVLWDEFGNPNDPCLVGIVDFGNDNYSIVNSGGSIPFVGTYDNSTAYFVPVTTYSNVDNIYAISINGGDWCFDMGQPIAVQYLPEITSSIVEDCSNGSATVTINGGLPAINGSDYTASNLLPVTASFDNTTCTDGGSIVISGLDDGENYSFEIIDENGCPHLIAGGPFQGNPQLVLADSIDVSCFGLSDGEISLNGTGGTAPYQYSIDGGNTFSFTTNFTGLEDGLYDIVIQDAVGCLDNGTITLEEPLEIDLDISSTNPLCFEGNDGTITISAIGGTPDYNFSIDGGINYQLSGLFEDLNAGTYDISVTDDTNCEVTSSIDLIDPDEITLTIAGFDATCFESCDGEVIVIPNGGTNTGTYDYSWNNPNNSTTPSVDELCAGMYTVIVTDDNQCSATDSVEIFEPAEITSSTSSTESDCGQANGSATVNASGGEGNFTYAWYEADETFTGVTSQTMNNSLSGDFYVIVTDGNDCTDTSYVTIDNIVGPIATIIDTTMVNCYNDCDGSALVEINGGNSTNFTYDWILVQTGQSTGISTAQATDLCAGTYIVNVQDDLGCLTADTVTITQPEQLILTASNDTTICIGSCVDLTGSITGGTGTITFGWTIDQVNFILSQDFTDCPTENTQYFLVALDQNNCSDLETVNVTINPPINVNVTALGPTSICPGDSIHLSALATGGNGGPYSYSWSPNLSNTPLISDAPLQNTTYIVNANDNCGSPTAIDSLSVTIYELPIIDIDANREGCYAHTVNFIDNTSPTPLTYDWNFGDPSNQQGSNQANPTFTYNNPGQYDVTLSVLTNEGCQDSTSFPWFITVYDHPEANFLASSDSASILLSEICFTDNSIDAANYNWNIDNGNLTSTDFSVCYEPDFVGCYPVELVVENEFGCIDTSNGTYCIYDEFIFFAPNAFSPNNDDSNDEFYPVMLGVDESEYELLIYDRWGNLIFNTDDIYARWDGKVQNGPSNDEAQIDVYVWMVKLKDTRGNPHKFDGIVALIR